MNLERRARAQRRFGEALGLFEWVGDARGVADILDARAMAVFLDGEIVAAVDALEQAAQLFVDPGNLLRVVTPRATRGHALIFAGDSKHGLADAEEAVELASALGYPLRPGMVGVISDGRRGYITNSGANSLSVDR